MIIIKAVGIVCEYNPFHTGHKYHIEAAKKLSGADAVCAVMSGSFVQRGGPAVFDKYTRAKAAVSCGADLVIELPGIYSGQSAQPFAAGAVKTLLASNCIDSISFGTEQADTETILKTARIFNDEPPELKSSIKSALSEGIGYPSAKTAALKKICGIDFTSAPNNILAVEYTREILKSGKNAGIYPVLRKGSEHDSFGSASYIRGLIKNKRDYSEYVPGAAFDIFKNAKPVFETDFENLILYKLRTAPTADLSGIADISEGLENRFKNNAACKSLHDLYTACSAKRYSHARIRRALFNILLGITKTDINTPPQYIKVLAANKTGCALIKEMKKKSEIPVITKPSLGKTLSVFQKEAEITAVYALAGTISADAEYTATPYINEN